ncbi:MAG TPA: hypothetical protein PLQ76_07470 [bacterium]|nr:hypothetical protein [bacterium]
MKKFEYEITAHSSDDFKLLTYFCTDGGDCAVQQLPGTEMEGMRDIMNARGNDGWELVQLSFGKKGIVAFWKREVS